MSRSGVAWSDETIDQILITSLAWCDEIIDQVLTTFTTITSLAWSGGGSQGGNVAEVTSSHLSQVLKNTHKQPRMTI